MKDLQTGDAKCGVVVDHRVIRHDNVDDHHQMHEVTHDIQVCPTIASGEGCHERHDPWSSLHGHFILGHVNEMVEVTTPLCQILAQRSHAEGC
jgi:hypothetical protein